MRLPVRGTMLSADAAQSDAGTESARQAADLDKPLRKRVIAALRTVRDPEIPVNIYDLGLIYQLDVSDAGEVHVRMTLTTPACPVAQAMPGRVETRLRTVPGVTAAKVELVWDPPWSRERIPTTVRLELGLL
jgi:FeS assembly SUF system protein